MPVQNVPVPMAVGSWSEPSNRTAGAAVSKPANRRSNGSPWSEGSKLV